VITGAVFTFYLLHRLAGVWYLFIACLWEGSTGFWDQKGVALFRIQDIPVVMDAVGPWHGCMKELLSVYSIDCGLAVAFATRTGWDEVILRDEGK
jgi:hypothetical protein